MKLFAFEEDEVVVDAVGEVAIDEQAEEVIELQEEATAVDATVETIEEGEAATDQLEEAAAVVGSSIEQGEGLDPVAAEAMRIAVQAVCARINAPTKQFYPLYATENFQSKASRLANSKLALESITDTLKAIWAKIKEQIMKLVAKIKAIWDKVFNNMDRTYKAVVAMAKKVDGLEGSVKSKDPLASPSALTKTLYSSEVTFKGFEAAIGQFNKASETMAKVMDSGAVNGDVNEVMSLPFGTKLTVKTTKDDSSDSIKLDVAMSSADMEMPQSATAAVLSKSEMKSLLSATKDCLSNTMKTVDRVNSFKTMVGKMEAEMEKQIATAGKSDEEAEAKKEALKKMREDRTKVLNTVKAVSPSFNVMAVRLARSVMTYVKFSMGQYKKA